MAGDFFFPPCRFSFDTPHCSIWKKKSLRLSPILFHLLWVELWRVFPFLFFPYQKHYPEFPPLLLHWERGTDKDVLVKTLRRLNSSLSTSKLFTTISGQQSSLFPMWQPECAQSFFNLFFIVSLLSKQPKASVSLTFLFPRSDQSYLCFPAKSDAISRVQICLSLHPDWWQTPLFFNPQATTKIQKGNTRRRILIPALYICVSLFSSSCLSRGNSPNPREILTSCNLLHLITPQHYLQPTLGYKSIPCLHSKPSNIFNQRPTLRTITDTCTRPLSRSMGTSAAWLQWTNEPRWHGNTINPALRWRSLCVCVVRVCACQWRNDVWKHKSKARTPWSAKCRTAQKGQPQKNEEPLLRTPAARWTTCH